jgi:hypothetical protein
MSNAIICAKNSPEMRRLRISHTLTHCPQVAAEDRHFVLSKTSYAKARPLGVTTSAMHTP